MMRTDQSVRDLTEKHRYARSAGDEQGASRYKKMMTSFGVAALFEGGRRQQHIVALTGLSLVDIDHIPAERMGEVLALVRGDEHTLLAYTTLSGHGVRVLARYALNTFNDNDNVNDNCYPLRSVSQCSTPLVPLKEGQCSLDSSIAERSSSEPAEYRTNQKELSPFKGDERNEVKRNGAEGVTVNVFVYLVPEKYSHPMPRQGSIRQQRMLVAPHESEHLAHPLGRDMVYIHEAQPRELYDVLLPSAALEEGSHAEARHHLLVSAGTLLVARGTGIAVLLGKVAHRLVRAHHRHHLLEGDRPRLRVVHTVE